MILTSALVSRDSKALLKMKVVFHVSLRFHYENMPIQIYRKNLPLKIENFQVRNANIFLISAQNIDCGYSLEPPQ